MNSLKGNVAIIVVAIVAMLALAGVGYLFWQNQQPQDSVTPITSAQPTPTYHSAGGSTPTISPLASLTPGAVVVFEAAGSFSVSEKDEITKKVINPFLDYYKDLEGDGYVVSLTVSHNTNPSIVDYPFSAKAIFKNGAYSGFVITKATDWWLPDCLMKCEFSESFKMKYPEIVSKLN